MENSDTTFENLFRLGDKEYSNIFEKINQTNAVFKNANDL